MAQHRGGLIKLSDLSSGPSFITGFGETMDPIVTTFGGDLVPVLATQITITLAITGFCAMGPMAIITVPLSMVAGFAIVANGLIVAPKFKRDLEGNGWVEPSEPTPFTPPGLSCGNCHHFTAGVTVGICTKFYDSTKADDYCDDWAEKTIVVSHKTIMPEPIAAPIVEEPPQVAAKPTMIRRSEIAPAIAEEVAIAGLFKMPKSEPAEKPLSPMAQSGHEGMQRALKSNPEGFTVTIAALVVEHPDTAEDTFITLFEEISTLRSAQYFFRRPTLSLEVKGVK